MPSSLVALWDALIVSTGSRPSPGFWMPWDSVGFRSVPEQVSAGERLAVSWSRVNVTQRSPNDAPPVA